MQIRTKGGIALRKSTCKLVTFTVTCSVTNIQLPWLPKWFVNGFYRQSQSNKTLFKVFQQADIVFKEMC